MMTKEKDSSSLATPKVPKGFQIGGSALESHSCPIYCVSWSRHLHTIDGGNSSQEIVSNEFISYFATCGGPHATIYEVFTKPGLNNHKDGSSRNSKSQECRRHPIVRQVYRDVDEEENFYACAFGGRGVGAPVGYSPLGTLSMGNDYEADTTGLKRKHNAAPQGSNVVIYFGENMKSDSHSDTKSLKRQKKSFQQSAFPLPYDTSSLDGPPLLCLAGVRGVIKVIDTYRRSLFMTLAGHGDEITDMKFSPTNEWLLLTSSKDESIRLWNLQRGVNVAVFTGHDGHRGQVLSIDWHCSGTKFVSGGMDNMIKMWKVLNDEGDQQTCPESQSDIVDDEDGVETALRKSFQVTPDNWVGCVDSSKPPSGSERKRPSLFRTVYRQRPYFSTNKVHTDYVDCVQFVGDLVLSKSVHNVVVLWKPLLLHEETEQNYHHKQADHQNTKNSNRIPSSILFLREFTINHCNSWFVRFHSAPPYHRLLALGNQKGEVRVWEIGGSEDDDSGFHPHRKYFSSLTTMGPGYFISSGGNGGGGCNGNSGNTGGSTVRMVAFSPFDSSLVAVCDDSTVWKWDVIH
mmetsp:Transcript_8608/g.18385  ORF Transcript_8608/g.18385 Transcript_8608/m.18385 type:complete len:571 (+) Transcript_8608:55-1767(+)